MCGIVGCYYFGAQSSDTRQSVDRDLLLSMRDQMRLRGPDDAGEWISENNRLGLAHRRLSVLDLDPRAKQPMQSSDGRFRIVYNGELYNYQEIRSELEAQGHVFKTSSDTEVLLQLYQERGIHALEQLRGMYSFAIWDAQEESLTLVRDPFGIKPLYYSLETGSLRFASSVKALLLDPAVGKEHDATGVVSFFLYGHVLDPHTIYRDIKQVPAGSSLKINRDGDVQLESFCDLETVFDSGVGSQNIHQGSLPELLGETIEAHFASDVPIGVFLSSGIDSSAITALASQRFEQKINTITLGFEEYRGTPQDEVPLAEEVAKMCGTSHQTQWITQEDFSSILDSFFDAMDQPTIDGLNTYLVSRAARQAGLTVVLSGLGGDELFAGYPSFKEIPPLVRAASMFPAAPSIGAVLRQVTKPIFNKFSSPKYASLLEFGSTYGGAHLLRRGLYMPWELKEFLDPDLVEQGWAELSPVLLGDSKQRGALNSRDRVALLELTRYTRDRLLRDCDWAGMAHSLEIRVPLLDITLLRGLRQHQERGIEYSKNDVAAGVSKLLPDKVVSRDKTGFTVPLRSWLSQSFPAVPLERGWRSWAQYVWSRYQGLS